MRAGDGGSGWGGGFGWCEREMGTVDLGGDAKSDDSGGARVSAIVRAGGLGASVAEESAVVGRNREGFGVIGDGRASVSAAHGDGSRSTLVGARTCDGGRPWRGHVHGYGQLLDTTSSYERPGRILPGAENRSSIPGLEFSSAYYEAKPVAEKTDHAPLAQANLENDHRYSDIPRAHKSPTVGENQKSEFPTLAPRSPHFWENIPGSAETGGYFPGRHREPGFGGYDAAAHPAALGGRGCKQRYPDVGRLQDPIPSGAQPRGPFPRPGGKCRHRDFDALANWPANPRREYNPGGRMGAYKPVAVVGIGDAIPPPSSYQAFASGERADVAAVRVDGLGSLDMEGGQREDRYMTGEEWCEEYLVRCGIKK